MEKSVDAFRTISEVADDLDLPQHVLRFWETRFAQIRPLKRAGGRRYYRPADVQLLRNIRQLLYDEGYTIKGVQRLLRDRGPRGLRDEADGGAARDGSVSVPADDGETATADAGQAEAAFLKLMEQDRACLVEALDAVESCERILRAALHPEPEGKRLQADDGSL